MAETIRTPTAKIPKRSVRTRYGGWESLPSDLLLNIYGRLRIEDLLVGPPLACRHWYSVSLDPCLYKDLDIQKWYAICKRIGKYVDVLDLLRIVVRRGRGEIERLWLPQFYLQDLHLVALADTCPNIKFFFVRSLGLIDEKTFCYAVSRWKRLEGMAVDEHALKGPILESISSSCMYFSSLSIIGTISNTIASDIVDHLPKLKPLKSINVWCLNFWNNELEVTLKSCADVFDNIDWERLGIDFDEILKNFTGLKYPPSETMGHQLDINEKTCIPSF